MKKKYALALIMFLFLGICTACDKNADTFEENYNEAIIVKDSSEFKVWEKHIVDTQKVFFADFLCAEIIEDGITRPMLCNDNYNIIFYEEFIDIISLKDNNKSTVYAEALQYLNEGNVNICLVDINEDNENDLIIQINDGGTNIQLTKMYIVDLKTLETVPVEYTAEELAEFVQEFTIVDIVCNENSSYIVFEVIDAKGNKYTGNAEIYGHIDKDAALECTIEKDLIDVRVAEDNSIKVYTDLALVSDTMNYVGRVCGSLVYSSETKSCILDISSVRIDIDM